MLPDGASATFAKSEARFLRSIENAHSWFEHAEERDRVERSLILVTGHVKSRSWGVAAIANTARAGSVSLNFSLSEAVGSSLSGSHSWQGYSPWMCNTGPRTPSRRSNQCVFLTGFKITRRHRLSPFRLLSEVRAITLKDGKTSYPRPRQRSDNPDGGTSSVSKSHQTSNARSAPQARESSEAGSSNDSQVQSNQDIPVDSVTDESATDMDSTFDVEDIAEKEEVRIEFNHVRSGIDWT